MTLIPAYGREYKNRAAVLVDWHSGKDFIIADNFHAASGKPTNKFDCQKAGDTGIMIRYDNMRKQCEAPT
jgi:hypothetical protein